MSHINIEHHGLKLVIEVTEAGDVRLLHCSSLDFDPESLPSADNQRWFRLVELQATGYNQKVWHGPKYVGTCPAQDLKYVSHRDSQTPLGRKLEVEQAVNGLTVISHFQFYNDVPISRCWTEVVNGSKEAVGLEYVSSFCLVGVVKEGSKEWDQKTVLHVPHNSWNQEAQWQSYAPPELGLNCASSLSFKRLSLGGTGSQPTTQYLPTGCIENGQTGSVFFWQIEHNGSWHCEISDTIERQLYLQLSGPTHNESHWWKNLQPGQSFTSVPAAVGSVGGGLQEALQQLTRYRRMIRRPHHDNEELPVIFDDYMHSLAADPTEEKELPLIEAAAKAGCECYIIDAGWYANGEWWDEVGLWQPSEKRFPRGLKFLLDYIRQLGMVPGLWIEPEVMGINCPMAAKVADEWFFMRHGKRVIDNGRYQLDFRNPEVTAYLDSVIDRMVQDYGIGYMKIDYNINIGVGTDHQADSPGEGLLQHNLAFLAWLDRILERFGELTIETCASGGQRMDYAMLSRLPIESISDQTDYRKTAAIAAAIPSALTPEQALAWSYPLADGDCEEVIFNMINTLLLRICQSGPAAALSPERFELIKQAIAYYKTIRQDIKSALPFWPLGMPHFYDPWISLGLKTENKTYLAVWRLTGESTMQISVPHLENCRVGAKCGYPAGWEGKWKWDPKQATLAVTLPQEYCARLFELEKLK